MTDIGSPRDPGPESPQTARKTGPLAAVPLVLAAVVAILLLGGVLFALASASAAPGGDAGRYRLLGQAANPFIAFLALAAAALVSESRRRGRRADLIAGGVAIGIATAVSLAIVLLAINGLLTDLTGDTTALFRVSAIVSRLATLALSGTTLWMALTTEPARP